MKHWLQFLLTGIITLFLLSDASLAQEGKVIYGRVTDAQNQNPVANATVYIANTSIGAVTNEQGYYRISRLSGTSYDLLYSSLGYEVSTRIAQFGTKDSLEINVKLKPNPVELETVVVKAKKDRARDRHLRLFRAHFIGSSRMAKECIILNPDDITFFEDKIRGDLIAHTKVPIKVRNNALGYEITILLQSFRWQVNGSSGSFVVNTFFKEMESTNSMELLEWKKNRQRVYVGSMRHFFISLLNKSTLVNGFDYDRHTLVPLVEQDFQRLNQNNKGIQLDPTVVRGFKLLKNTEVRHLKKEANLLIPAETEHFLLYPNGTLMNPKSIAVNGPWGLQRIAEMLPQDYDPNK